MKKDSYYGSYFWLTLVAFIVPLFVAYKAFDKVSPTTKPTPNPDVSGVDHGLWDYLLKSHVENGLIDYQGIGKNYLFRTYLQQLGSAEIDLLETEDQKLALYCNAYNAFVVNGVISHKIQSSVNDYQSDGVGFFDLKEHILGNETVSLNQLEHKIIRPTFKEPRIHMALVCAAKSCPAIRPEAYIGKRVQDQLEDQARLFANDKKYVSFDEKTNTIHLSPILKWYGEDWDHFGGYRDWLAKKSDDSTLKKKLKDAAIKVEFNTYDWALNSTRPPTSIQSSKSHAGSGSIPNE